MGVYMYAGKGMCECLYAYVRVFGLWACTWVFCVCCTRTCLYVFTYTCECDWMFVCVCTRVSARVYVYTSECACVCVLNGYYRRRKRRLNELSIFRRNRIRPSIQLNVDIPNCYLGKDHNSSHVFKAQSEISRPRKKLTQVKATYIRVSFCVWLYVKADITNGLYMCTGVGYRHDCIQVALCDYVI